MSNFGKLCTIIALGALATWWYQHTLPGTTAGPFLAFLAVGQGDATYLRTATGADLFIDGGPDRTILERAPEVMQPADDTIETIILTHPDADHITGVVELVKRYHVTQLITTALPATKPLHQELLALIASQGIQHTVVSAGDRIQLSDQEYLQVLYPAAATPLTTLSTNNTSMILEYHGHHITLLVTGDIEAPVEDEVAVQGVLQDVDILKVAHHGSKTSSTAEFLAATTPEICMIEVGKDNQYGHPHAEVLARLQAYCQIRRTDQEGTIIMPLSL